MPGRPTVPGPRGRIPRSLFVLFVAAGACAGEPDVSVTRTDSAGVVIVTSAGPDRILDWRFHERLRLGGDDAGPGSFYAVRRDLVATDTAGRIYVLDSSARRVAVFDSEGRHLQTLGREGAGPGELEMPGGVAVDGGVVGVWDFGKAGLVRFGHDGEPLPTFTSAAFWGGRGLALRATGAVFRTRDLRDPENRREVLVVLDTTASGEPGWRNLRTVVSAPVPDASRHLFEQCGVAMSLSPLFYPALDWAWGPGRRLFVNREVEYVVDVYDERDATAPVASYRRALEPRRATRELAERSLGEGMTVSVSGGLPCTIPAGEVLDARGFASRVPLVANVAVDPGGRVWVERTAIGHEPTRIDILTADGAYIGTLVDAPVPLAFLPGGDVLAAETDALDVDRLVVYRVEEPAGSGRAEAGQ